MQLVIFLIALALTLVLPQPTAAQRSGGAQPPAATNLGAADVTLQSNFHAVLKSQVQQLLNAADGGNSLCAGGFNPFGLAHTTALSAACQTFMTTTAHGSPQRVADLGGQIVARLARPALL